MKKLHDTAINKRSRNSMDGNCTVLVCSCDAYSDLWVPFFKLLKIQWPDRPYPIVLNTETKSFEFEDMEIITPHFKGAKEMSWGERLINVLNTIESEYVLLLLEDYFLQEPVNQGMIDQCLNWMINDHMIACFYLIEARGGLRVESDDYPGFEKRKRKERYKISAQASIWRKELLLKYTSPADQTAWDWEMIGSQRCEDYTEAFYSVMPDGEPAFKYYSEIRRGKWMRKIKVFEKYGIDVDYDERGFVEKGVQ